MYGELKEQWFTSHGCIPRYEVLLLDGKRFLPDPWERKKLDTNRMQAELLRENGIPFLNGIKTQRELAVAIVSLDGRWNNDTKTAPFLACGDYEKAAMVLEAIIKQHEFARERKPQTLSEEDLRRHQELWTPVTSHFREPLEMVRREDPTGIQTWLENNIAKNKQYARFCMKGTTAPPMAGLLSACQRTIQTPLFRVY